MDGRTDRQTETYLQDMQIKGNFTLVRILYNEQTPRIHFYFGISKKHFDISNSYFVCSELAP